jgi:LPXTG-motif cell wall-anchored protein
VDHAVAARVTAIKVRVAQGGEQDRGYGGSAGMTLDVGLGVLESVAVAPEAEGAGVSDAVAGTGGSLPITGPRVDVMLIAGGALLIFGTGALVYGLRRRRFQA